MAETGEVTTWKGVRKRKDRFLGEGKWSASWVGEVIPSMISRDSAEGKFLRVGGGLRVRRDGPEHGVVGSSSLQVSGVRGRIGRSGKGRREGMASSWKWKMRGKEEDFREEVVVMVAEVLQRGKRMLSNDTYCRSKQALYTFPLTESVTCRDALEDRSISGCP